MGVVETPSAVTGAATMLAPPQMVKSITTDDPTPVAGERYIVPVGGTGVFAGQDGKLAIYTNVWTFLNPTESWFAYVNDEDTYYLYNGATWETISEAAPPALHAATHLADGTDALKTENSVATTDATVTTIATIPITDNTAIWLEVDVIARRTNAADRAKYKRGALIYRESAGAAVIEGSIWEPLTIESDGTWDCTITVSVNNALIRVTGTAAHDINWKSAHIAEEVS